MTRLLLLVFVLALPGGGSAGSPPESPESKESADGADRDAVYVILTESESSPEELLRRYPELTSSWDELARFNLLRRPKTAIEIPSGMMDSDRRLARIADAYGEAEVRRRFDDHYLPTVDNLLLQEGDVVRTWRHSGARILFDDGSHLVLRSHSKARVVALAPSSSPSPRVRVELTEGTIWSKTEGGGGFVIETPSANTMTRGTDYRLKVESGETTRLEVLEGAVELETPSGMVRVAASQGALTRNLGETPTPEPLPSAPERLVTPQPEQVIRASTFDTLFEWTPVPGAQSYRLEIARDIGFFDLAEERLTGARTSSRIRGLEPGTYFWRVSALSPSGFEGPPVGGSYFVFVERR